MFVSGPIPSFSSIPSAISLSTACEAAHTTAEADESASSPLVSNARLLGRGNAVHARRSLLPPQSPPFSPYATPHSRRMRTRSLKSGRAKRQSTASRSSSATCTLFPYPSSTSPWTSLAAKVITSLGCTPPTSSTLATRNPSMAISRLSYRPTLPSSVPLASSLRSYD